MRRRRASRTYLKIVKGSIGVPTGAGGVFFPIFLSVLTVSLDVLLLFRVVLIIFRVILILLSVFFIAPITFLILLGPVIARISGFFFFNAEEVPRPFAIVLVDEKTAEHCVPSTVRHLYGSDIGKRPERAVEFVFVKEPKAQKAESPERSACGKRPDERQKFARYRARGCPFDGEVFQVHEEADSVWVEGDVAVPGVAQAMFAVDPEMELVNEGGESGVLGECTRETGVLAPFREDDVVVKPATSLL